LGEAGVGVRSALREDSTLWELAEAPLLLNVMTLAYSKEAAIVPFAGNTPEAQREHLFNAYVNRMFQRRSSATRYAKEQTLNWLSWLAQQMQQHALTVFYIERLQPYWLSVRQQTILKRGCLLLVLTLFLCCTGLIGELSTGLIFGLIVGLIFGLSAEIRKWFFRRRRRKPPATSEAIRIIEVVRWSWPQFLSSILPNLGYGLSVGLILRPTSAVVRGLIDGLSIGLSLGLGVGLFGGYWGMRSKGKPYPTRESNDLPAMPSFMV